MNIALLIFDIRSNNLIYIKLDAVILTLLLRGSIAICKFVSQFERRNID
jgi:hypothetical protein